MKSRFDNADRTRYYGVRIGDIVSEEIFQDVRRRGEVVGFGFMDNNRVYVRDEDGKISGWVAERCTIETKAEDRQAWVDIEMRLRRSKKFIDWMICGQFQHGISPMRFPDLTPERAEELYNVDFGN